MILAFYSEASGTGKDTAATYAADALTARGRNVARDAFAWDGKVVCADALGIPGTREEKIALIDEIKLYGAVSAFMEHPVKDHVETFWGQTGRDFIIGLLGSPGEGNGIRGLDEGFWTRQVLRRAGEHMRLGGYAAHGDHGGWVPGWTIVSDMRFVEEAEAVCAAGGKVVELVRDKNVGRFNEQRLSPELIDHTIWNTGTLEDLRYNVEWYVGRLIAS
jgi:hypothetical protein